MEFMALDDQSFSTGEDRGFINQFLIIFQRLIVDIISAKINMGQSHHYLDVFGYVWVLVTLSDWVVLGS